MSASVVCQPTTEIRITDLPAEAAAAEPAGALVLDPGDHGVGDVVVVEEAHEHLVEDDVVEDLDAVGRGQPAGHARGEVAAAVDELGHAGTPERAQRRVHAARRARGARTPASSRSPRACPRRGRGCRPTWRSSPRAARRRRRPRRCRSRRGRSATCGRRSPTSRPARSPRAAARRAGLAAAHRPKAPSTWHQAPCARQASTISASGSNAPVLTSPACAQTIAGPSPLGERRRAASGPASGPGRRRARAGSRSAPSPSMRQATVTVTCACSPAITRTSRRALQPVGLDVPAGVAQHRVAGRRQAGEVRHLAAGDEADAAARGQPEQLAHPAGRDLLGDRQRRGRRRSRRRSGPRRRSSQSAATATGSAPPMTNPK